MTLEASTPTPRAVLVWDAPVRVFHWLLAASFIGAYVSAESERWRLLHVSLGYTVGALVIFRLLWGLLGTRHARFASFVRGPRVVARYLRSLVAGHAEHHVGHNPAGALAIVGLLAAALVIVASGWATYNDVGGGWLEDLHEGAANAMLALVFVHVAGVIVSSRLHHENLLRSMLDGRKQALPTDGIQHAWRSLAALMVVAVAGFWTWQWSQAPDPAALQAQVATVGESGPAGHGKDRRREHDHDD